jgi:hypothetical protein
VTFGGAGVYGASPGAAFTACCNIAFLGDCGPIGTGGDSGSSDIDVVAVVVVVGGLAAGIRELCAWCALCALCTPGDEENLEDMLDNHEFRRELGEGEAAFGEVPFTLSGLSVEALLEYVGRCGIGFGAAAFSSSFIVALPLCIGVGFVLDGGEEFVRFVWGFGLESRKCTFKSMICSPYKSSDVVLQR